MAIEENEQFVIHGEDQMSPARLYGRTSVVLTLVSLAIFCFTWVSMWGPVYLGLPGWLYL